MDILSLDGKVGLITGAGRGVGRQAALHFAAAGAKGIIVNDYVAERAEKTAGLINAEYGEGRAIGIAADVTNFDDVMSMVDKGRQVFGPIDILVNNAGNAGASRENLSPKPFWEQEPKNWEPWLAVNLGGVMNCARACIPDMVEKKSGSIVNVISDAGRVGEAGLEAYSAAKAGAAGLTRALARSLGRYMVRANCVAISATNTPATSRALENEAYAKKALRKYVIRRFGQPDDIANMILMLASDASSWVTGQTYPVNGGFDFSM